MLHGVAASARASTHAKLDVHVAPGAYLLPDALCTAWGSPCSVTLVSPVGIKLAMTTNANPEANSCLGPTVTPRPALQARIPAVEGTNGMSSVTGIQIL